MSFQSPWGTPAPIHFLIWYYIETITLEEGEMFLDSNGQWNTNVHSAAKFHISREARDQIRAWKSDWTQTG